MSEQTTKFLVSLSHQYQVVALLTPVFGCAIYFVAGVFLANMTRGKNARALRAAKVLRPCALLAFLASVGVALVSVLHIGCASAKSHTNKCLSNVRQISLNLLVYSQDYNETLPPANTWADHITKHLQSGAVPTDTRVKFHCPSATTGASYGLNQELDGVPHEKIDRIAGTVLLFEVDTANLNFAGGSKDVVFTRHGSLANFAFTDGHALSRSKTSAAKNVWKPNYPPAK